MDVLGTGPGPDPLEGGQRTSQPCNVLMIEDTEVEGCRRVVTSVIDGVQSIMVDRVFSRQQQ